MKKHKFTMKDFEQIICIIIVLLGIVGAIYSVNAFYIGFHNVDLSYNICVIANDLDLDYRELRDNYDVGKDILTTNLYIIGNRQMQRSILTGMLSSFIIGYFFVLLFVQRRKE